MNSISLQRHFDQLEDELQVLKWQLTGFPLVARKKRAVMSHRSIVQSSAGILGKHFLPGRQYEDSVRRVWHLHDSISSS